MKLKSLLTAGALATTGLLGVGAPAASAAELHPCHEYHPTQQPVEYTICMWYYLTK